MDPSYLPHISLDIVTVGKGRQCVPVTVEIADALDAAHLEGDEATELHILGFIEPHS
jgi:hypothetical protein